MTDPIGPLRTLTIRLLTLCRTGGGVFLTSANRYSSVGVGAGGSISGGGSRLSIVEGNSIETSTVPAEIARWFRSVAEIAKSRGRPLQDEERAARLKAAAVLHFSSAAGSAVLNSTPGYFLQFKNSPQII